MPRNVYRTDDPSTDPKPPEPSHLSGSQLARARMIERMGGNQERMDWLEHEARLATDRDARQKHPPTHTLALRDHQKRFDSDPDRKKGELGSQAARRRYLERLRRKKRSGCLKWKTNFPTLLT